MYHCPIVPFFSLVTCMRIEGALLLLELDFTMALVYPIIFVIASSEWIIVQCKHQTRSLLSLYFRLLFLSVFSINHATVTVCSVCISLMNACNTLISYCPDNKTWTSSLFSWCLLCIISSLLTSTLPTWTRWLEHSVRCWNAHDDSII